MKTNNHVTRLDIDASALEYNLNFFKSKVPSSTKTLVVVKAFGYGLDALKVASLLKDKVDYLAVAYTDEGIALRESGIETPILVLHPHFSSIEEIAKYHLEPSIYSKALLDDILDYCNVHCISEFPCHLKFNTGLNRLGFSPSETNEVLTKINDSKRLKILSVFSHIAASEDLNEKEFTLQQISKFKSVARQLDASLPFAPMKHMLNTSGILNYAEEGSFDMVRLGIGLYGFGNDPAFTKQLKNVISLHSVISQIHEVSKGESVGYNRAFKAETSVKTATIPIGHADGYVRAFGDGKGYVYINNQKAPIIGNVCMDMIMVNVTDINCSEGDTVTIFKDQEHLNDLAQRINTIPYELLTIISQRVHRNFL